AQVATELLDKSVRVRKHGAAVRAGSDRLLEGLGGFRIDLHNEARRAIEQIAAQVDLTGTIERAESAMRRALAADPRLELLYLGGDDGREVRENLAATVIRQALAAARRGANWSPRPWFPQVMERRCSFISPVYHSAVTDAFCYTVTVPVL